MKSLLIVALFALSAVVSAQSIVLQPGDSIRAQRGQVVSCVESSSNRPGVSRICQNLSQVSDNETFRQIARSGFGYCTVNSKPVGNSYVCYLTTGNRDDISNSVLSTQDDRTCYSLFDQIKDMAASGELERLCGSCNKQ